MTTFIRDYLERLGDIHQQAIDALHDLPQGAMDWTAGTGFNSLCVLTVHLCGAERYLIGEVIGGEPAHRDRPAEFEARDLSSHLLQARLQEGLEASQRILQTLSLEDLESERDWPREGTRRSVAWVLSHALAHAALHAGHMQITHLMWLAH